jgi:ribosome-associated protein
MPAKKATTTKKAAAAPAKKAAAKKSTTPPAAKTVVKKAVAKKAAPVKKAAPAPVDLGTPEGMALAELCCQYACEKKATHPVILDVRKSSSITDFTVIVTGTSLPHLRAIRKEIADRLWEDHRIKVLRMDGTPESLWMVADFADVMVHIFHAETRERFGLEDLWGDAPRTDYVEKR